MKSILALGLATLLGLTTTAFGGLISGTSSMKDYQTGSEKLTVYTDVPGHNTSIINGYASRAKSDIYEIWVRSAATDNVWVQCFANMTYNRGSEMPLMTNFQTPTAKHAYQKHTAGWTHTYANIEMSENSPVEVEIRKIGTTSLNGSVTIVKSAVHPAHKIIAGSKFDQNGRVYFKISNPCQVVIDINGQMDDHNAAFPVGTPGGAMTGNLAVHSIALYANPILAKPVASPTNVILTVNPASSSPTTRLTQPDPATYNTLVFAPGIHNVGANFKLYLGKSYYIPGDAIVYGNIGNSGVPATGYRCNGDRIRIFGYGTLCGIQVPHYQFATHDDTPTGTPNPEYPEWNAWVGPKDQGVGIVIENAWDVTIQGVTSIDPANFNTKFDPFLARTNDQSLVNWVKLHSWRVNGDGFGGYCKVEDSFFRTSDDSTYVRDWRRRCTFWKDTNANLFRFVNYKAGGVEDCDILYCRWRDQGGVGSVFEFATGSETVAQVVDLQLTLRNIRFHDKHPNPTHHFDMETLESYRGLTFENISFYTPKNGNKSVLKGSAAAPWHEQLVFKNVTFKNSSQGAYDNGTLLTAANFNTYFDTNAFVKYTLFDYPRNLNIVTNADPVRGSVSKSPNQATHVETSLVTLTAKEKPGYAFSNWTGLNADDPSTDATAKSITIRMLDHRTLTANFVLADIANPVVIDSAITGSWAVPAGVYSITFDAWGGGGAGGSAQHTPGTSNISVRGGGGSGAGFARKTMQVFPGQIINYAVGAGGAGSDLTTGSAFPASGSFGGDGGTTSASLNGGAAVVSAVGGLGGQNRSGTSTSVSGSGRAAATTGSVGDIVFYGGGGAGGNPNGTGGGGGSAGDSGAGGTAPSPSSSGAPGGAAGAGGGVAGAAGHNNTNPGNAGAQPGAGGSGAAVRNNSTSWALLTGGKGGDGKMIVTYNTMDFTLTTQAVNGSINRSAAGPDYRSGSSVTLTAVANPGYRFVGWSGDLSGSANPATVLMDGAKTVTANFIQQFTLTTNAGTGGSISAGGVYDAGTSVTVTASAASGYRFGSWSDDATGSSHPLTLIMDGNKSVTANFIQQFTLTTNAGIGGTISGGGIYDAGTTVSVIAYPSGGYRFGLWSGDLLGTNGSQTLVMNSNKSVAATFIRRYTLTTNAGSGSITGGGTYDEGTYVSVSATAPSGSRFKNWSGSLSGTTNPGVVLMNGPKTITAEYIQVFKLETAVAGGTLTLSPPGGSYDAGTVVTATATPNQGGQFDGWNGSLEGTTTPIATLTMNGPKSISPRFKYISILTTPGANSWSIPDGVSSLAIQAWGGGGAGGTASAARTNTNNTQARGGGGAGGGFASTTFVVTPGQTLNYSVGAGGIAPAQAITNGTDSTAGSDTTASIDTTNIVTARGGNGGKNVRSLNSNISGTGGTAPIDNYLGTTTYLGGSGATSNSNGTGGGGGSAGSTGIGGTAPAPANGVSPAGSAGTGGGAAGGAGHNSTANGNPGGTPGAGGSGGAVRSPSQITPETYTHRIGGPGADGQMIITYTASATPPAVPGVPQSPVPTLSCTLINNNTEVELRWPLSASQWRLYSYDITQTNPWIEIPPALYQSDANGFFWRTTAAAASDFDFCLIKP